MYSHEIYNMHRTIQEVIMILCNLQSILDDRDISQRKLAAAVGANKNTISDLCRNDFDRVSFVILDRICRHLNIRLSDLMIYKP